MPKNTPKDVVVDETPVLITDNLPLPIEPLIENVIEPEVQVEIEPEVEPDLIETGTPEVAIVEPAIEVFPKITSVEGDPTPEEEV